MKTSLSIGAIVLLASIGRIANAQVINVPQSAPYTKDTDTVLLEHFDGTTTGKVQKGEGNSTQGALLPPSPLKKKPLNGQGTVNFIQGVFGQGIHLNDTSFVSWNLGALPEGTLEFWFKLDNMLNHFDNNEGCILASANYDGLAEALTMQATVNWHLKPYTFAAINRSAGDWVSVDGNVTIKVNVWYHFALTWGKSGRKHYLNGNLIASDTTPTFLNSSTGQWAIGAQVRHGNDGFNGVMDELRISKVERQFTASQVAIVQPVATAATTESSGSNSLAASAYVPKHFDVEMPTNPTTLEAAKQALAAAKQELAAINGELDKASREQAVLEAKVSSGKRKIPKLQSRQEELKRQGADLDDEIKKLQSQEAYVFQSAGASLDAQDFSGALQAYKDFVGKFPQSARVGKAKEIIASLEQKLGVNKQ